MEDVPFVGNDAFAEELNNWRTLAISTDFAK